MISGSSSNLKNEDYYGRSVGPFLVGYKNPEKMAVGYNMAATMMAVESEIDRKNGGRLQNRRRQRTIMAVESEMDRRHPEKMDRDGGRLRAHHDLEVFDY